MQHRKEFLLFLPTSHYKIDLKAYMQKLNMALCHIIISEKKELYAQMVQLDEKREDTAGELSDYLSHWEELSISDKITVVDCFIERIVASKDRLEIKWKI